MTAGFGTRNLLLLDQEKRIMSIYDAQDWAVRRVDLGQLGVGFSSALVDDLSHYIKRLMEDLRQDANAATLPPKAIAAARQATAVVAGLVQLAYDPAKFDAALAPHPGTLIHPQAMHGWLMAGDTPAESFHEDDYDVSQVRPLDIAGPMAEVDCAVSFSSLGDALREYPVADDKSGYAAISLPFGAVSSTPLDPRQPLPVIEDFIGLGGVGVRGELVNIDAHGRLAEEKPVAIPLLHAAGLYLTLYLVVETRLPENAAALTVRQGLGPRETAERFAQHGFTRLEERTFEPPPSGTHPTRWELWGARDGRDLVQYYHAMPGIESDDLPECLPYAIATSAGGSQGVAGRASVLSLLGF